MVKSIFLNNKILVSSVVHKRERSRQDDKEQRIGVQSKIVCHRRVRFTGGDNSNKRCFGTKPKLLRESGDFSGNRDTWKFFRETRDNSGTLQKKILEFMSGILRISGKVTQKFGRMIQISGTTYVRTQ